MSLFRAFVILAAVAVTSATPAFAQTDSCAASSPHQNFRTQDTLFVQPAAAGSGTTQPTLWIGIERVGILRSTNGGRNWSRRDIGLRGFPRTDDSSRPCIRELGRIVADPADPSSLYVLRVESPGRLDMPNSEMAGIFETRNSGATWTQLTGYGNAGGGRGLAAVVGSSAPTVFMGVSNGQASWAGAPSGFYNTTGVLYKSTNGGATWTELDQRTSGVALIDPYLSIAQVFTDPTGTRIWAPAYVRSANGGPGIDAVQVGFLQSSDGGTTWTRGASSLPDSTARGGLNGDVARANFNHRVLIATNTPPSEGAPPGPAASWFTTDGVTWNKTSRYVYVARYSPHDAAGLTVFGYDPFAGAPTEPTQGVLKSIDGGATWTRIGALPPGVDNESNGVRISNFAFHPTDPNTLYASGSAAHVWRSTDGGVTWTVLLSLASTELGGPGVTATTVPGAPGAPTGKYADGLAFELAWTPPTSGDLASSYIVQTATNAAFTAGLTEHTSADVDDFPSLDLGLGTTFASVRYVRVIGVNAIGRGAPSTATVFHALTPRHLVFSATKNGAAGGLVATSLPVTVQVPWSPSGAPAWTASSNVSYFQVTGGTGTGAGQFTVSVVNPANVIGGSTLLGGTITVSIPSIGVQQTLSLNMTVRQVSSTSAPFGQVDTPIANANGVQGAIGVTGWVLDDLGVAGVKIYRNCLPFENQASCQAILGHNVVEVGDAAFLSGARADVEAAFQSAPNNHRAGWGYLMLTSMLPHVTNQQPYGGQGPLTIYAIATDVEGNRRLLGRSSDPASPQFAASTSITMANDSIAKPFGAIDTPAQGQTVSGVLNNFGWALTPDSNTVAGESGDILIPTNGSTMTVFIDSMPVATVAYNQCRGDVGNPVSAGVFCNDDVSNIFGNATPRAALTNRTSNTTLFRNLDAGRAPIGAFTIDTRTLSNGLHTIAWSVTDSAGRTEGIGSRFFVVLNSGTAARVTMVR